mmetsp:Transcript_54067/g.166345  ORF Transcript_54067/g.166345 Transcript_54067/m.166345 type:complete len:224 (+) Transcript_54067:1057-1728(+)
MWKLTCDMNQHCIADRCPMRERDLGKFRCRRQSSGRHVGDWKSARLKHFECRGCLRHQLVDQFVHQLAAGTPADVGTVDGERRQLRDVAEDDTQVGEWRPAGLAAHHTPRYDAQPLLHGTVRLPHHAQSRGLREPNGRRGHLPGLGTVRVVCRSRGTVTLTTARATTHSGAPRVGAPAQREEGRDVNDADGFTHDLKNVNRARERLNGTHSSAMKFCVRCMYM